ncbi:MAG: hypothetical protein OEY89_02420 [Gammaproteobacteria bacterium]|nr:hypothetical protein [Gammaproteobacteria bacterium]
MSEALEVVSNNSAVAGALSVQAMKEQIALIHGYMKDILIPDEHYGKTPGCGAKDCLFKSGAEKLMFGFNLRPEFVVETIDHGNGHREEKVVCRIYNKTSGQEIGQGVGCATTLEPKWKYRSGVNELTEFAVPKEFWTHRSIDVLRAVDPSLEGLPLATQKNEDGKWMIAIKGAKVEHPDPAEYYNTILKMAKKRAFVDAVITATACSDIFTQDIEEGVYDIDPPVKTKPEVDKPVNQQKQADTDLVTKDQLTRILQTAKRVGWTNEDVSQHIKSVFKKEKGSELTVAEANMLLQAIEPQDIPE